MARAQASASLASRGPVSGVPKVASAASPMNLSTVPPCSKITASIRPWKPRSISITSAGERDSEMAVKSRISVKSTPMSCCRGTPKGWSRAARVSTIFGEK